MQNNILTRIDETSKGVNQQIVIPKSLTALVIAAGHDDPLSGHLGVKKT